MPKKIQLKIAKKKKLLGVKIGYKLIFSFLIFQICKKDVQKMNTLSRIVPNINMEKRCTLLSTFFISQFMCYSRGKTSKVNRLHERCLGITYNSNISTFEQPLVFTQCISYLGPKIWEILPQDILKVKIKSWMHINSLYKICKLYVRVVEYI